MNCIARDPKARAGSVLAPPDPHAVRHKAGTAGPRPPSVGGWRVARPRVDSRRRIPRLLQHCSGRLRAILPAWESCQKVGRNNARGMRERLLPPTSPVCSAVPQIFSSHLLRRDTLLLLRSSIFLRKRAFVVAGGQIPAGATSDRICGQHSRHSHCTAMPSLLCYCWRRGRASVASRCVELCMFALTDGSAVRRSRSRTVQM